MSAGSQGNSSFLFFLNSSVAGVDLGSYYSTETSAAVLLRGKICFKFGSFDAWALWGHLAENSLILSGKSNGTRARCTLSDTVGLALFVPYGFVRSPLAHAICLWKQGFPRASLLQTSCKASLNSCANQQCLYYACKPALSSFSSVPCFILDGLKRTWILTPVRWTGFSLEPTGTGIGNHVRISFKVFVLSL